MQATRKATVRFKERSELLDFLLEVAAATSQTLDLAQLFPDVAKTIHRVSPTALFPILLYTERRKDLRIRSAAGNRDETVKTLWIPRGGGVPGPAPARREPILVGDVRT